MALTIGVFPSFHHIQSGGHVYAAGYIADNSSRSLSLSLFVSCLAPLPSHNLSPLLFCSHSLGSCKHWKFSVFFFFFLNNFYTTCSVIKLEHMCTARDDVDGQRDGKAYGNVDGDKGDNGGEVLDKSRVGFCCCCSTFVSAFRMCRINYSDVSHAMRRYFTDSDTDTLTDTDTDTI